MFLKCYWALIFYLRFWLLICTFRSQVAHTRLGAHHLGKVMFNLANLAPAGLWKNILKQNLCGTESETRKLCFKMFAFRNFEILE